MKTQSRWSSMTTALNLAGLFSLLAAATCQTELSVDPGQPITSPVAASKSDARWGFDAIFAPVHSCLSEVILVIYVQSLPMLNRIDEYKSMYGPYVGGIEFYVDGTWCDPRSKATETPAGLPCYGDPLDRSSVPAEVHVVDGNGGGWMMQRSLMDAVSRPRDGNAPMGFLFITDDVLINTGQLSRAVRASGCQKIWRSALASCDDEESDSDGFRMLARFSAEAKAFYEVSGEEFRAQLKSNLGSSSKYCIGVQNDFIYIPTAFAHEWAAVAQQMTDAGLVFAFAFYTAILGITSMESMLVLRSSYLSRTLRADYLLKRNVFRGKDEPYCWEGEKREKDLAELLASHIIHPNKMESSAVGLEFAQTVNPPAVGVAFASHLETCKNAEQTSRCVDYNEDVVMPFWCPT